MPEPRTRRMPRPLRLVACLTAFVLVLGVVFAGIGRAEEAHGDRAGGPGSAGPRGEPGASGQRYFQPPEHDTGPDSDESEGSDGYDGLRPGDYDELRSYRTDDTDDWDADDGPDTPSGPDSGDQPGVTPPPASTSTDIVPGTPCTEAAAACVSLGAKRSWLFTKDENGDTVIDHGPVSISTGGPGRETPVGDFAVEWKHKDHQSSEYFTPYGCTPGTPGCRGAPMKWAVFFAEGGIAFHQGTLNQRSSGCVRLTAAEAEHYYNFLQIGNKVEVRG